MALCGMVRVYPAQLRRCRIPATAGRQVFGRHVQGHKDGIDAAPFQWGLSASSPRC
jgi:hypothetical protein